MVKPVLVMPFHKNELKEIFDNVLVAYDQVEYYAYAYYTAGVYYFSDGSYIIIDESHVLKNLAIKIYDKNGVPYAFLYQIAE